MDLGNCPKRESLQKWFRGGENGVFGKRSFCWGDTRHFRHFRRFPGSEEQNPLFLWAECNIGIFPFFVKTTCFRQGSKRPFSKTTGSATLMVRRRCKRSVLTLLGPGGKGLPRVFCTTQTLFCTGATPFRTSARRLLLMGSKRPFAPSPSNFRDFHFSDNFPGPQHPKERTRI